MPWYTDAGVLFYRADLLEKYGAPVPTTWTGLADTAARIVEAERAAGDDRLLGFVFQGRAYEGLTCNALEWIASSGGGTIVDADGEVTVDNPAAAAALDLAASWVGTIAPEGVLTYTEEEARGVFQSGNAVFMRNWPYAWALAQSEDSPVRGAVGVAPLPSGPGGTPTGTLGGYNLAVSRYSKAPEAAADLVMFLTSADEQKRRAIAGAYNPTIPALYKDPEVLAAVPFLADLYPTIANAVARPSTVTGDKYNRVSAAFWGAVHGCCRARRPPGRRWTRWRASWHGSAGVAGSGGLGGAGRVAGQSASARRAAALFLAPMLLALALVAGWPLGRTIFFAFTDASLTDLDGFHLVGIGNFWNSDWGGLLADPAWWQAVRNTLVFAGASVAHRDGAGHRLRAGARPARSPAAASSARWCWCPGRSRPSSRRRSGHGCCTTSSAS